MRTGIVLLTAVLLISVSCAGIKKNLRKNKKAPVENLAAGRDIAEASQIINEPIKEVEEKLIPLNNVAPDPSRYFVIIGSFRNPENAKKHLSEMIKKGFDPEILRNEAGLYRVSVLSTDEITQARSEVRRIWSKFPEHGDTWLLISKK